MNPPVVPPGIQQFFVPSGGDGSVHYVPVVIGAARVGFGDSKLGIDEVRDVLYAAPLRAGPIAVDWADALRLDITPGDLRATHEAGSTFAQVPAAGLQAKSYAAWGKDFTKWLSQSEKLELFRQPRLKLTSRMDESERDFMLRVNDAQRVSRDAAVEALRKKYAPKQAQFAERLRRAEAAVERETAQAAQQKLQTGLSVGATIFGAIFGRKTISSSTLGRATTAARGMGRSMKESEDIKRASESLETIREQVRELEEEIRKETEAIALRYAGERSLERIELTPKRGQVAVQFVALGWMPGGRAR